MHPKAAYQQSQLLPHDVTNCDECGLHRQCKTWKVKGVGEAKFGLMLVGEAPGEEEDLEGRPFIGKAGQLLSKLLARAEVDRSKVYITNAVKCRPTKNGKNRTPSQKEMDLCSPFLEEEIKRIQPKVILTLGNSATQAVIEMKGIETLHGREFTSEKFKCRVVPTYHPAAALYEDSRAEDIQRSIVKDIRFAVSLCSKDTVKKEKLDYVLADSVDMIAEIAERLETDVGRVTFDWEGTSREPLRNTPLGIAFSWKPGTGIYVPVTKRTSFGLVDYWKDDQERVKQLLRRCLLSKAKKVAHFGKYDCGVSKVYLGIMPANFDFCSGMAHHLIDENADHDLDSLAMEYTPLGSYKRKVEVYAGKRNSDSYDLSKVPLEELYRYACGDADAELRLYYIFRPKLVEQGLWQLYERIVMPMVHLLVRMELRGVCVDAKVLREEIRKWGEEAEKTKAEISSLKEAEGLNINNPKHVSVLLFDRLGIDFPEDTRQKERSTNKEVLESIESEHPVVKKILAYRKREKLIGTYGEKMLARAIDGVIHANFKLHGTVTGRISCDKPNLQNITKDEGVRRAFVARKGYKLVLTDFSQVELRGLAYYSRDPLLLKNFTSTGMDLHTDTAAYILRKDPKAVSDEERKKYGKSMNFGMAYGLTPVGVASVLGVTKDEAAPILSRFWTRYPGVTSWKEKLLREARARGNYIVNIFGRRRRHPDLSSTAHYTRRDGTRVYSVRDGAEREVVNSIIQGTCSADIPNFAAIRTQALLDENGIDGHLILQEHDGLVWEVRADQVEQAIPMIVEEMEKTPHQDWDIPLKVDVAVSDTWSKAKPKTEKEKKDQEEKESNRNPRDPGVSGNSVGNRGRRRS